MVIRLQGNHFSDSNEAGMKDLMKILIHYEKVQTYWIAYVKIVKKLSGAFFQV